MAGREYAGSAARGSCSALVVSGFLGSGKTTLVRDQLALAQREGVRVAVVSNEFGALGIDRALFGDEQSYVELEGGCVCCQLSDALVETLERLRREVAFDRVIVETSGLALPYETQLQLWREPVRGWIADDLSVVVVNAEQLRDGRDLDGTFEDQVSSADLLLLNKIDLVRPDELPGLERALLELAPDTPIVHTLRGRVDPDLLFMPGVEPRAARAHPERTHEEHAHDHAHFRAEQLELRAGVTESELRALLAQRSPLRAKGFVCTDRGLHLVQGVGPRIELEAVPHAPPGLVGRIVAIVKV